MRHDVQRLNCFIDPAEAADASTPQALPDGDDRGTVLRNNEIGESTR